jgi:acetyl-CoA synthetase
MSDTTPAEWVPSAEFIRTTNLYWLMQRLGVTTYPDAHAWSASHRDEFWSIVRERLAIRPGNIAANCFSGSSDAIAIVHQAEGGPLLRMTLGELDRLSNQVANGLLARGLQPGEGVAVVLPMNVHAVAVYLGIIKAGGAVVSIADSFMPPEIAVRLRIGRARLVFTQVAIARGGKQLPLAERVAAAGAADIVAIGTAAWEPFRQAADTPVMHPRRPGDPLNILFSSGTTGEPKAIPWTHETPLKCAMDGHFHHNIQPGDVVAWPTNLGWMMGPWLIFAGLINRATLAIYDGAPTEAGFGRFVQYARVTLLGVVPSLVRTWRTSGVMDPFDWRAIKAFSTTGECSNAADMAWLMARGGHKPVIEYCGGTEIAGGYIAGTVVQPARPAAFSTPALGLDIAVLDEAGLDSDMGEVFLIPPCVGFSTTLLNGDHEQVYYAGTPRPGLRRHGDQVERLPDGYYRVHGRCDDTMNLGGIKVSSAEIERAVQGTPGIVETAAIAVPPPGGGPSLLVLYAVGTPRETSREELQAAIRRNLNPLFKIHDLVFVPALPRTASNKVMRRVMRGQYQASHG